MEKEKDARIVFWIILIWFERGGGGDGIFIGEEEEWRESSRGI